MKMKWTDQLLSATV